MKDSTGSARTYLPAAVATANATVLIVDEPSMCRAVKQQLSAKGLDVLEAATAASALEQLGDTVDVVLVSQQLPDADGLAFLQSIKQQHPDVPVVMMSSNSTVEKAVEAVKLGAFHYISKDSDADDLLLLVRRALETGALRRQVRRLHTSPGGDRGLDAIVGQSPAMQSVKALLRRVAASRASTVLLTGETGTGKDLAARTIHDNSNRASRAFIHITCSALPEHLLESELFGHERGAFTDARQQKRGLLEAADGGTVFLDEIGEMTLPLQAKLLRFLEDKTFKRVGGLQDIRVDVRIVAATHRDLRRQVREGQFREDLFYRLQVMPIRLPALRERREDLELLANHFIDRYNRELMKRVRGISPAALAILERYEWPGNVRELRNAIERAMLLIDREWIEPGDVAVPVDLSERPQFRLPEDGVKLDEVEHQLLLQALDRTRWHQGRAAELLGINRDQVRYRMRKFGMGRRRRRASGKVIALEHVSTGAAAPA